MTTTATPADLPTLQAEVELYLHLADQISAMTEQQKEIKARIAATVPVGEKVAVGDVKVSVAPPSRRFNADRAFTMLTPEQQALCLGPVPVKIKANLPPVLLDACMDPGAGDPIVTIR